MIVTFFIPQSLEIGEATSASLEDDDDLTTDTLPS